MKGKINKLALVTIIILQDCCKCLNTVPKKSEQEQVKCHYRSLSKHIHSGINISADNGICCGGFFYHDVE